MTLRHYSYCMDFELQECLRADEGAEDSFPFDRARIERALAGPSFLIPNGLTPDEIREFILQTAASHSK